MRYIFIADFFADEIIGGGELNNEEVIGELLSLGHDVSKIKSNVVSPEFLEGEHDTKFIVANFWLLSEESRQALRGMNYTIYEHDHKYLKTRNPAYYEQFKAPKEHIVNYDFYKHL